MVIKMSLLDKLSSKTTDASAIVNKAFEKAAKETGAVLDSETTQAVKDQTIKAMKTASQIAKNMSDLNGDGKIDIEDVKHAAEKAGIAWNKIDPDLKTALVAGGVAGVGINVIPLVGQFLAVPAFAGTTAYFYLVAKLTKLKKDK
jgi:hypothetical protein